MKCLALITCLLASPAFAADVPAKAPPSPPTSEKVDMSLTDLQVALIAISNAGAACDIGVKQFCPLLPVRDATTAKLQAALNALQPTTAAPKP